MRRKAAVLAAFVGLGGCEGIGMDRAASDQAAETEAPLLDPALAAHLPAGMSIEFAAGGRDLFPTCGVCHGVEGEGTALGPSLRDQEWIQISGELSEIAAVIRSGVRSPREYPIPMPALGGGQFDDEQVEAIAAYVFLLSRSGQPAVSSSPAPQVDTAAPDTTS